jgi:hypothetical protein
MKLIVLPTDILQQPEYANAIIKNKMLYGWFMMSTIFAISRPFIFGDWCRNGCRGLPYEYWFAKDDLFHYNGIKTKEHEKEYYKFLDECAKTGVLANQQDELNIKIEFPDMMKYVDETQIKDTNNRFGVGKLPQYAIDEIRDSGGELSRETLEQIKLDNKKTNNNKTNTLSNYKEDNIPNPFDESSSSQAPSDKGSDDIDTYAFGQQVVNDMDKAHREYEEVIQQAKNL